MFDTNTTLNPELIKPFVEKREHIKNNQIERFNSTWAKHGFAYAIAAYGDAVAVAEAAYNASMVALRYVEQRESPTYDELKTRLQRNILEAMSGTTSPENIYKVQGIVALLENLED